MGGSSVTLVAESEACPTVMTYEISNSKIAQRMQSSNTVCTHVALVTANAEPLHIARTRLEVDLRRGLRELECA